MRTYSRWSFFHTIYICVLVGTVIVSTPVQAVTSFKDPLDHPALMRTAINTRPLMAITYTGAALVAVGSRGMIIRSEDSGKNWTQSTVPVQSDLLAVQFPTLQDGWAVGHSGVILHSSDGGRTWTKQFDGRMAAGMFKKYYMDRIIEGQTCDPLITAAAKAIELNYRAGPTLPWLGVWFKDAQNGIVVGSYGMIAATDDGGKTWEPWMHRIDNEELLNLNSISGSGGNIYIAGERGMVYRLDREKSWFQRTVTGYAGSFFGIVGNANTLLAFGLRGVLYRSDNGGTSWEALESNSRATVTAGVSRDSKGFILVNSAGQFLLGDTHSRMFTVVNLGTDSAMRYSGVVVDNQGNAVVTGLGGVRTLKISDLHE